MPKRKNESDIKAIAKKLKRIEKQLEQKGRPRRRRRIISTSSEDSTHSPENQNLGEPLNPTEVDSLLLEIEQTPAPNCHLLPAADVNSAEITETENVHDDLTLDGEALDILGEDPNDKVEYGSNIRQELANRLEHIATCGLNNDLRKELIAKYPIPGNCTKIAAPGLNPEIKAAVSDIVTKKDRFIETRQKKIASVISCLANAVSAQLEPKKIRDNVLLKHLMDASRLLCDVQHDESLARRIGAISTLKKETKESLYNTNIDKLLFGENLTDSLKTAKAILKSGTELKTFNKKPLNWKAPVAARRQPTTPRRPAPAAAATVTARPYQAYWAPPPLPPPPPPPPPPPRSTRNTAWRAPPPPPPRSTRRR